MTYGSASGVGALSSMWSDSGSFTTTTTPTLAEVTIWISEVSALIDSALADEGFIVPITVVAIVPELDMLTNGFVKDLVDYSHQSGRFYREQALQNGIHPILAIDKEIHSWVQRKSNGFELQGAEKTGTGRKEATFDTLG